MTDSATDSSEPVREQSEVVAAADLLVKGNGPAVALNLSYQNAVSHQQAMNQIQLGAMQTNSAILAAATGKITEMIIHTSPSESGPDIAALMQIIKAAQSTPSVSA